MDEYHSPETINLYHRPGDVLDFLLRHQEWLAKHWTSLTPERLQDSLVPSDFFCWAKRALELRSSGKALNESTDSMDRLAPFFKCSGCQLAYRLRFYPWLNIRAQTHVLSAGRIIHSGKHWTLPPRHTNVLLSVIFQSQPHKQHFQNQLLTYNCGDATFCLQPKWIDLDQVTVTDVIVRQWIQTLFMLSQAYPGLIWGYFDKKSLCVPSVDSPFSAAGANLQLRNFDRCSLTLGDYVINPITAKPQDFSYGPYRRPSSYPGVNVAVSNFYLYLLTLLCHRTIYDIVQQQPALFKFVQSLFRPSEFPSAWKDLKDCPGSDSAIKELIARYFTRQMPNLTGL